MPEKIKKLILDNDEISIGRTTANRYYIFYRHGTLYSNTIKDLIERAFNISELKDKQNTEVKDNDTT